MNHILQEILETSIQMIPELFLLNILPDILDSEKSYLTIHIIRTARTVFAKHWKESRTPQINEVIGKILETTEMDVLSDWLDAKKKKDHQKIWWQLYTWLQGR